MEDYYLLLNNNFSNNKQQEKLSTINESIYFQCISNNDTFVYCRRNLKFYLFGFNNLTNSSIFKKIGQMTITDLNNISNRSVKFQLDSNQTNDPFLIHCRPSPSTGKPTLN